MKLQKYIIDDDWFKNVFYLYIGEYDDMKKRLENEYKNLKIKEYTGENGNYFAIEKDNILVRIIWLKKFDWTIYWQSILTHEILHYVFASLKDKGFKYHEDGEEAYTYYMEKIFYNVWAKLKPIHPKIKRKKHAKH